MKNLLFGILIISSVYSQCNETNWQEFFPYLMGCSLSGVDFSAELEQTGAYCGMINFSNAKKFNVEVPYFKLNVPYILN